MVKILIRRAGPAFWLQLLMRRKMKAVVCTGYGPPEVLQIREVDKPLPKANEVLVRVMASAVNSGDVRVRSLAVNGLMKVLMRLVLGFHRPRKAIPGTVYAGLVESLGKKVSRFKAGDKVFGMRGFQFGTYAEYMSVHQNSNVTHMPDSASFAEAAALIFGGQTAIYFLEKAGIAKRAKPKILIIGASGSVGTSAVLLARHHEADITAICSTAGSALVKSLGVDKMILYDHQDFTRCGQQYDIIFDAVRKSTKKECKPLLKPGGIYFNVNTSGFASENVRQLELLRELYEQGKYQAVIDRIYPLGQIADAHRYVDTGRKKGNVVLSIGAEVMIKSEQSTPSA